MAASSTAEALSVTVPSLLKKSVPEIATNINRKAPRSSFDSVSQALKDANLLLLKTARMLDDPNVLADSVKQMVECSIEVDSMKSGWERALAQAAYAYSNEADEEPQRLGKMFFEKQKEAVRLLPENHEFWKRFQAVVTRSGAVEEDEVAVVADDDTDGDLRFMCPITKSVMKNPVKHEPCGHHYDKQSIEGAMKSKNGMMNCPVRGCKVRIDPKKLTEDVMLLMDIQDWEKTEAKKKEAANKKKKTKDAPDETLGKTSRSAKKGRRLVEDDDVEDD